MCHYTKFDMASKLQRDRDQVILFLETGSQMHCCSHASSVGAFPALAFDRYFCQPCGWCHLTQRWDNQGIDLLCKNVFF